MLSLTKNYSTTLNSIACPPPAAKIISNISLEVTSLLEIVNTSGFVSQ